MSASVPIVAYEGEGVNSIVISESGILTQINPKALGEAIRSLLLDKKSQASMAIKCRERATQFYATEVLGQKLTAWLSNILLSFRSG